MNALITGSNGFLGSHLAIQLAKRGDAVRCLVRPASDKALLADAPVQLAYGDVTDPSSLTAAVKGNEVIFHLAGIRRSPSPADFDRVNVQGTRHVLEAAAAMPNPARVVFASSLAAVGPSERDRPHVEDDARRPTEWYGESKSRGEDLCVEFRGRVPVTVIRPPRIIGPGDRENLFFFKIVKRGFRLVIGGGPRQLSLVDVDDVVDALVRLADHPRAVGQSFFVAAEETLTLEGLLDLVAGALKVVPRTLRVPQPLLLGLSYVADMVSKTTGKHLPLNRKLARQLLAPGWTCSIEKAKRLLGFAPKVSLEESIERSAQWYLKKGWL